METSILRKRMPVSALFDPKIVVPAIGSAFVKLDPRTLIKNPVMFVLEVVTALTTVIFIRDLITGGGQIGFEFQIILWLWFTVLFANFAEAIAEGRGKAQADTLRRQRTETQAKLVTEAGDSQSYRLVPSTKLKVGDVVLVEAGDMIPSDGEVIEGMASVNEAAITGESAPVIRESGGDRSAVTGGTLVLSDWIRVRITAAPGSTFLDRMIRLVEGAERQKTPNEIALNILLIGLTIIFVFATATIPSYVAYAVRDAHSDHDRRAPFGHRHRRHGPPGALQCAGHVGPFRRGRGRCRYAASRQDRHDYARQSSGDRVQAAAWRYRTGVGRRGATGFARR
jgi:potassium-transporting ATPase ATP-binding subunit